MKIRYFILTTVITAIGLLSSGINFAQESKVENAKQKVKDAKVELKDAQAESDKEYREFKTAAELKISDNEKRIAELKVKINTADADAKVSYDKKVAKLEKRNTELKKKISEYKYEGGDQWIIFKRGVNRDLKSVGKAIKDLFSSKD